MQLKLQLELGIGNIVIIDNDIVDVTNINRQLIADVTTVGKSKVQIAKDRILKINPNANITIYKEFYNEQTSCNLLKNSYNYIIDAIDSVPSKLFS